MYTFIAIDLKSFYASVECVERQLNPLTTNLVVADASRTDKTICLAVSPSLKSYGISGRARLFEVNQKVKEVNRLRKEKAPYHQLTNTSYHQDELVTHPEYALDFIIAPPQMAHYMEISAKIYKIYLKYIAPEDIHVYSIDEVFIDATHYLNTYQMNAKQLARQMIQDVLDATGITATAGIGPNLYLCKVAMDIVAKKMPADKDGVRIAMLDELAYRELLWSHRPLTDFWRVGRGYTKKLEANHLMTMGDIARCSIENEELLFQLFGVNAELLIDHAWGYEPCTMKAIKSYKPEHNQIGSGQVLQEPYGYQRALVIIKEMADRLAFDLTSKHLVTKQLVLTVGYDRESLDDPNYQGPISTDWFGRAIPKSAHGTIHLEKYSASASLIQEAMVNLYQRIINRDLLIRRINMSACNVLDETKIPITDNYQQLDLFTDYKAKEKEEKDLEREKRMQEAILQIRDKYGKNAILKGTNFEEGSTNKERNNMIGGHRAK